MPAEEFIEITRTGIAYANAADGTAGPKYLPLPRLGE
jgi:hypothetical protein